MKFQWNVIFFNFQLKNNTKAINQYQHHSQVDGKTFYILFYFLNQHHYPNYLKM